MQRPKELKPVYVFLSFLSLIDTESDVYSYLSTHALLEETVKNRFYGNQKLVYSTRKGENIFGLEWSALIAIITEFTRNVLFGIEQNRFVK